MTVKRTRPVSLEELWAYEASHPVVFAAPRALAEARLIAQLERLERGRRVRKKKPVQSRSRRKLTTV